MKKKKEHICSPVHTVYPFMHAVNYYMWHTNVILSGLEFIDMRPDLLSRVSMSKKKKKKKVDNKKNRGCGGQSAY